MSELLINLALQFYNLLLVVLYQGLLLISLCLELFDLFQLNVI